jgi:hypothetical protein
MQVPERRAGTFRNRAFAAEFAMRRSWLLALFLCAVACGRNPYGDHPPHPVSGRVLVNGKPADGADVTFYHVDDWGPKTIVPVARTDEEGRFALSTYDPEDGAPVGGYQVEITWPAYRHGRDIGPDRLGNKYAKRGTSGLTASIDEHTRELPPFDLKADLSKVKLNEPKVGHKSRRDR